MNAKEAFDKLFGNLYIACRKRSFQMFEHGYKAGAAAENEACAKVCESLRDEDGYEAWGVECADAIRARMKND